MQGRPAARSVSPCEQHRQHAHPYAPGPFALAPRSRWTACLNSWARWRSHLGDGFSLSHRLAPRLSAATNRSTGSDVGQVLRGSEAPRLQFPKFPFGYFWMAVCLRERNDPGWREYASKALDILRKTTILDGHHKHHDEAKREIEGWFAHSPA